MAASSVPNAIAVGPMSSGLERGADRVGSRDPHQPVLDDAVRHVLLRQGSPDLGDLLHREAAVLGHDHRPGVREFLAKLGDRGLFGLCRHMASIRYGTRPACGGGSSGSAPGLPCDGSHGNLPREADPGSQGRTHRCGGGTDCLGVLVVVPCPTVRVAAGPVRRIKSGTTTPKVARYGRRLSAAVRLSIVRWRASRPPSRQWCRRPAGGDQAAAAARVRRHVDPDARAHRAGDRQRAQVLALGTRRLGAVDRVDQGREVVDQRLRLEAALAHGDVDDRGLVDLELDAAALDLPDRPLEIEGDRAGLRVRHEAAPTEDLAEPTDDAHRIGRRRARRRTPSSRPRSSSTRSSPPTSSAPARSASWAFSPWAKTATRTDLPVPCGRTTVPRTIWSAWRGSTPRRRCASIVASKLTVVVCLDELGRLIGCVERARGRRASPPPGTSCRVPWSFLLVGRRPGLPLSDDRRGPGCGRHGRRGRRR